MTEQYADREPLGARLDAFIEHAEKTGRYHDADFYRHCKTEIARLTVALHRSESQLMAHRYMDEAPEDHPIKRMMSQKPKGIKAYPKHRGTNHLEAEIGHYGLASDSLDKSFNLGPEASAKLRADLGKVNG